VWHLHESHRRSGEVLSNNLIVPPLGFIETIDAWQSREGVLMMLAVPRRKDHCTMTITVEIISAAIPRYPVHRIVRFPASSHEIV
jgi:hypothetical protein